jgi:hypothetical protein
VYGGYRWKTRSITCTRSGHSHRTRDIERQASKRRHTDDATLGLPAAPNAWRSVAFVVAFAETVQEPTSQRNCQPLEATASQRAQHEARYHTLGVQPIWFKKFAEIPGLIRCLA